MCMVTLRKEKLWESHLNDFYSWGEQSVCQLPLLLFKVCLLRMLTGVVNRFPDGSVLRRTLRSYPSSGFITGVCLEGDMAILMPHLCSSYNGGCSCREHLSYYSALVPVHSKEIISQVIDCSQRAVLSVVYMISRVHFSSLFHSSLLHLCYRYLLFISIQGHINPFFLSPPQNVPSPTCKIFSTVHKLWKDKNSAEAKIWIQSKSPLPPRGTL